MTPEEVPQMLIDILDRRAGKAHSRTGSVVSALAEILTAYEGSGMTNEMDREALLALRKPLLLPDGQHVYLSTGCLHEQHDYCKSERGLAGGKVPAHCKFCNASCVCECHEPDSSPLNSATN